VRSKLRGDQAYRALTRLAAGAGAADRLIFHGRVRDADLPALDRAQSRYSWDRIGQEILAADEMSRRPQSPAAQDTAEPGPAAQDTAEPEPVAADGQPA
jgi:hypothetical protein